MKKTLSSHERVRLQNLLKTMPGGLDTPFKKLVDRKVMEIYQIQDINKLNEFLLRPISAKDPKTQPLTKTVWLGYIKRWTQNAIKTSDASRGEYYNFVNRVSLRDATFNNTWIDFPPSVVKNIISTINEYLKD